MFNSLFIKICRLDINIYEDVNYVINFYGKMLVKKGNCLFNNAFTTFYLQLYGIGHMVKDHSDSKRGNMLPPPYGILFPISSKGSFICTIPQTG